MTAVTLRPTGETYQGKPTYHAGRATVMWDGRNKWVASDGYLVVTGATAEAAAEEFRRLRLDIHGSE